jgi:hypothetical protein
MKTALRAASTAALASLLGLPAWALNATDNVKINEVSYDPGESPEDPFEYLELFNAGGTTVFLDGAAISDEGAMGGTNEGTFVFPGTPGGTTIPFAPGAYLLVVNDATGSTLSPDWEIFTGGADPDDPAVPNLTKVVGSGIDLQLGNGGDGVTLSTGVTTAMSAIPCAEVVDGMSYDEGTPLTDVTAMSSTVCSDPDPNPGYANTTTPLTILSLQRCPNGTDTDNSQADFVVLNRTPKAANGCSNIPPAVASLQYAPCFVTAGVQATLSVDVTDDNMDLTTVRAFYRLDTAVLFDSLTMTLGSGSTYTATLPGQADQAHVQYYVEARDAQGNRTRNPSTAPSFLRSYRVGLQTITSLQVPAVADSCSRSSQEGKAVNVVGVVTHRAFEFSDNFFYIQQGITANSGIKVFTSVDSAFVPNQGDSVRVSGFVDEFNCQTELVLFADCGTTLGTNRKVRTRQLASVAAIGLEENESMLVTVQGPIDVDTGFDMIPNMSSEFRVSQGADQAAVGDDTFFPDGVGYTVVPVPGMVLDGLTGVVGYRIPTSPRPQQNVILRLEPRRDNDVDRDYTDTGEDDEVDVVKAFHLRQNQPNPFNPVTTIEFSIPQAGRATLRIFDPQGKLVRTLVDREYAAAGRDEVRWDGRDDAGRVVNSGVYFYKLEAGTYIAARKMLLLK